MRTADNSDDDVSLFSIKVCLIKIWVLRQIWKIEWWNSPSWSIITYWRRKYHWNSSVINFHHFFIFSVKNTKKSEKEKKIIFFDDFCTFLKFFWFTLKVSMLFSWKVESISFPKWAYFLFWLFLINSYSVLRKVPIFPKKGAARGTKLIKSSDF